MPVKYGTYMFADPESDVVWNFVVAPQGSTVGKNMPGGDLERAIKAFNEEVFQLEEDMEAYIRMGLRRANTIYDEDVQWKMGSSKDCPVESNCRAVLENDQAEPVRREES